VSADELDKTEPPQLGAMLSIDPAGGRVWADDELAAILRHQLAAQLEFDLGSLAAHNAGLDALGDSGRLRWAVTFAELLHEPRPALQLLEQAKRFAKACKSEPYGALPAEVATVLYFACILVARMHCDGARISALDDGALADGLRWACAQSWVDDQTRGLLAQGIAHLNT
jgi:hypothetical protein